MRYAFRLARSRPRKLLTVVTKSNAQRHGMVMWDEIAAEVSKEFPDVTWDKMLVDAMTARMTLKPRSLDTIVATNLHADILSDLAGALAGSLGVAPTANIDPERRFPSMFEPIHGSAFDITGKGIANPVATFWTAAQMLEHLGEAAAAARLMLGRRIGDRRRHSHPRRGRQGDDEGRDGRRLRSDPPLQHLGAGASSLRCGSATSCSSSSMPLIGLWVKMLTIPFRVLFPAIVIFASIGSTRSTASPPTSMRPLSSAFWATCSFAPDAKDAAAPGFFSDVVYKENLRRR